MKKILLMVVGVILSTPFFVSAQTAQLTDQFAGDQTTCVELQYNMSYRARDAKTNGEVSDLQDFLISQGYLSGEPTGYFGTATLTAVKKFQSAAGIGSAGSPGYGAIGPKTRAYIKNKTCGGTTPPVASLPAILVPQTTQTVETTKTTTTPTVANIGAFTFSSTVFDFNYMQGGAVPAKQSLTFMNRTNAVVPFTISVPNQPAWLSSGYATNQLLAQPNNPIGLGASINPAGLASGTYTTTIIISGDFDGSPIKIPVNLKVGGTQTVTSSSTPTISYAQYYPPSAEPGAFLIVGNNLTQGSKLHYVDMNNPSAVGLLDMIGGTSVTRMTFVADRYTLNTTSKYAVIVVDPQGKESNQVIVNTQSSPSQATSTQSTASSVSLTINGSSGVVSAMPSSNLNLSWKSSNVTGCYPQGNWAGNIGTSGSQTLVALSPTVSTGYLYTVACNTSSGAVIQSGVQVNVAPTVASVPTAVVTNGPTLQLSYDSYNKESYITAQAAISVTAGSSDLSILKPGAGTSLTSYAYMGLGAIDTAGHNGQAVGQVTVSLNAPVSQVQDNGNYWVIPAGKSAQFNVTQTFNPNQMFAGTYHAVPYLYNVVSPTVVNNILSSKDGNAITIIGERAPYINAIVDKTLAYNTQQTGSFYEITGVRFDKLSNSVTINGKTLKSSQSANGAIGFFASDFGITTSGFYSVQVSTAEGASNLFYANVTVPTATVTPSITVTSPNGGEVLTVGQTKRITWNSSGNIGNVSLLYQSNVGTTGNITNTPVPNIGYYDWTINVGNTTNTQYKIWILGSNSTTQVQDYSDNFFTVNPAPVTPTLSIVWPNAGTTAVQQGATTTIQWTATGLTTANNSIGLNVYQTSLGSTKSILSTTVANPVVNGQVQDGGSYNWVIPTTAPAGSDYVVYVSTATKWAQSNPFAITAATAPLLSLTANPSYTNQTVAPNTANVNIGSFIVSNPSSSTPVVFSTAQVSMAQNAVSVPMNGLTNLKLVDTSGAAIVPIGLPQAVNNFSPNISIAPMSSKTFDVFVDIGQTVGTIQATMFLNGNNVGLAGSVTTVATFTFTTNKTSMVAGTSTPFSNLPVLTWSSGASSCTASGTGWSGALAGSGSQTVNPPTTTTYTLVCGAEVRSVTITVTVAGTQPSNQLASVIGVFAQTPVPTLAPAWAYNWTRNLEIGSPYTDDVSALQTALAKEGVFSGEVTGGFYTQTYLAVKAFQTKYGIESTGFVGPITLAKLNELY